MFECQTVPIKFLVRFFCPWLYSRCCMMLNYEFDDFFE